MEEKKTTKKKETAPEQVQLNTDELSPELLVAVADIILEFKKSGSIKMCQLYDRLDKFETTPAQLEEIYKMFDNQGVQVVDEFERDKDLFDQLLKEVSMDDPVKMYLKDIGKVPLLQPDEETELAKRMKTSRSSIDRLLDPHNTSISLVTMEKAAQALGKKLEVQLA